jgi:hypothetical protein
MDVRARAEAGTSPMPPGVIHVLDDFVFRRSESTSEQRAIAIKVSTTLFGAWSGFVAAALAVRQRVVKGPNPTTNLIEDMRFLAQCLNFTFKDGILTVELDTIPLERPGPAGIKKTVVDIPVPSFRVGPVAGALEKVKLPTEYVQRLCSVLNFGLALTSTRSALEEAGDDRAKNMALLDFAGASLGVIDTAAGLPIKKLEAFRGRLAGKIGMGGALLGNRVAGTLGLLGAVASLANASLATAEEFDRGDWDEAMAHMTEGVGALISGAGATIILVSGATGPFALWTIGIGTAISAAGFLWSLFAADTEIDQMLKFCVFGQQSGQKALKPPGWSLCKVDFSEWNPNTAAGLLLQLRAFQQIFFSFEAAGADSVEIGPLASDGILRITPASARLSSSFEIDYTAVYSAPGVGSASTRVTRKGKARVLIPTTSGEAPTFVDDGKNYQTTGAIRGHKDEGRDALDVRFRLLVPLTSSSGAPLELESLTCGVQLRVPGMAAVGDGKDDVLIVPTTSAGPRRLAVEAVVERKTNRKSAASVKVG